ncbi:MAG: hypothetical protein CME53_02140 [Halieaceae bacterium]|nr:hypothetical protein [Halieaceae bacterium]
MPCSQIADDQLEQRSNGATEQRSNGATEQRSNGANANNKLGAEVNCVGAQPIFYKTGGYIDE